MNSEATRVLLIEDNEDDALIIREILAGAKGARCDLEWADRLATGLERLVTEGFELVLLDLGLPDSQGMETLRKARTQAPEAPIVVLTGLADETLGVEAVQEGAQDYLVKGQVDGNLLVRSMRHAIERQRLLASEMRLRMIIEENADAIIIVDRNGIVRFANPAAEALFDRRGEDLLGESFGLPVVAGEATEIEIIRRGGETAVAEMRVVETELHSEPLFLATLRDVTELVRLREELRAMSLRDELTGLYNRRGFFTLAEQQMRLAHRAQRGMLLLAADLDGLKEVNDTLGHPVGDRALIETAQVLKETFRESDIVARIGGDEFAVLALEASGDNAEVLANRLQENLEAHNARSHRPYELSLSFSVARYDPKSPCSLEDLMRRADARMYEQKRSKRGHRKDEEHER